MKLNEILLSTCLFLGTTHCGPQEGDNFVTDPAPKAPIPPTGSPAAPFTPPPALGIWSQAASDSYQLTGRWLSPCLPNQNQTSATRILFGIDLEAKRFFQSVLEYADSSCNVYWQMHTYSGVVNVAEEVSTNHYHVNFDISRVQLMLFSEFILDEYNSNAYYGIHNWKIAEATDIIVRKDGPAYFQPFTTYATIATADGKLFFSRFTNTPGTRPTEPLDVPYEKYVQFPSSF